MFVVGGSIALFLLLCQGCTKAPGIGGRSLIKGKLTARFYADSQMTALAGVGILADERVYIIYGNEKTAYDDDTRTSYDGSFQFNYLRPGKYVVFVYENCFPCASLQKEKLFEIEITGKDEVLDLGEIVLNKVH